MSTELERIEERIFTIRNQQVMTDRDLGGMYQVETRVINQAVKRNQERFPESFLFQLTQEEIDQFPQMNSDSLRSQSVISNKKGGRRYLPYAFTEQGVAMLSAVLRSDIAIQVSIQIMNAFISMRKQIASNQLLFQRLDRIELKQIESDQKFERIFKALESKNPTPSQGIFFDGQVFDAYHFVSDLIRKAEKSIILLDNYIDDAVLTLLAKRREGVKCTIGTKSISKQLKLDLDKFNSQYPPIDLLLFEKSHDRFLILDKKEIYHIGASIKDLGKKWFAFSKMQAENLSIMENLKVLGYE
jgi:hypothetical protein